MLQVALIADAIDTMVNQLPQREHGQVQAMKRKIERLAASAINVMAPHCDERMRHVGVTYCNGGKAQPRQTAAAPSIREDQPAA